MGDMEQKSIPRSWVKEKNDFLKDKLPKEVQGKPFYPDAFFYAQYYHNNPLEGLHYMATIIFSLLKIDPNGCIIDFYEENEVQEKSGDAAGFYTKIKDDNGEEKELILINSKHKDDPLAVGAILAHEMMHLYLFRLNLKLDDTRENELLTDLATINTGFPILIINGMSYSSFWWLTIILVFFGIRYWHSEQLSFGYFKPKEYGEHALSYFKERNLLVRDVIGYINPTSRRFISHIPFLTSRQSTEFIKALEKKHIKTTLAQGAVTAIVVTLIIVSGGSDNSSYKQELQSQIQNCRTEIASLENKINLDVSSLNTMESRLTNYENNQDIDNYNKLVGPYNSLLIRSKQEYSDYDNKLSDCNAKVDEYNNTLK